MYILSKQLFICCSVEIRYLQIT